MTRQFRGLAPLAVGLALLTSGPRLAAGGPRGNRELTVLDNGKAVEVRTGETLRFELPSDLRNAWVWAKLTDTPDLGEPKQSTRTIAEPPGEMQVTAYPIKSAPTKPTKVRWIYCRFGRPVSHADNKTPLKPGKPIREGEKPVEGMIYEVELRPAPGK